jgi:endonuclease/exonuclease/phosphatase (EEP) superfamily protein YafD
VLLLVAAVALAAWAGACFVDSGAPVLVAATSLAPVLSLLALPVLALGVAGRQVVPAVLALAAALVPWVLVAGSAVAGPGPTSGSDVQTLRVMTVDGGASQASATSIVRAARSFGADALVVTGLTHALAHDLTVSGLHSVVTPRWAEIPVNGPPGVGLWTTGEVTPGTPVPGFSQASAITVLTTRSGPVTLVVARAGGQGVVPDRNWRRDLRALAAVKVSGPRIMAGDLGATPWHPAFRNLRSQGWHEAADVLGRGLRPTWPSWGMVPFSPLEQVLVGGGAGVKSADTVAIAGTSHRALMVTVVLPKRASTPDA